MMAHVHVCLTDVLPSRVHGYKSSEYSFFPAAPPNTMQVWELYQQAATVGFMHHVCYSTFTSLWRQLLPHVVVMKPISDLCWIRTAPPSQEVLTALKGRRHWYNIPRGGQLFF